MLPTFVWGYRPAPRIPTSSCFCERKRLSISLVANVSLLCTRCPLEETVTLKSEASKLRNSIDSSAGYILSHSHQESGTKCQSSIHSLPRGTLLLLTLVPYRDSRIGQVPAGVSPDISAALTLSVLLCWTPQQNTNHRHLMKPSGICFAKPFQPWDGGFY